jgi:hypothetical protein
MQRNLVVVIALAAAHGRRFLVRVVLGVGLRLVFGGQFKQTFLRHGIAGPAGEAAASVGLLSKIKRLAIGHSRNKAGVRFGLSVAGA